MFHTPNISPFEPTDLLNIYNATRRGAVKLVMGIFIDQPQAQAKIKNRGNKVNIVSTLQVTYVGHTFLSPGQPAAKLS